MMLMMSIDYSASLNLTFLVALITASGGSPSMLIVRVAPLLVKRELNAAVGTRGVLDHFSTSHPKSAAAGTERPGRPPRPSSAARDGALTCARPGHRPE